MGKLSALPEHTSPIGNDILGGVDVTASATKKFKLSVLAALFRSLINTKSAVDANGWTVYDYGAWKEYRKKGSISGQVPGSGWGFQSPAVSLPVGIASIGANHVNVALGVNDPAVTAMLDITPSATSIAIALTNAYSLAVNYTVHYSITIITP